MHRIIARAKDGQTVDHINGNGLDNRKANLRICSQGANLQGSQKKRKWSDYRGVTFNVREKKWQAAIGKDYKHYYLGRFKCQRAAALAYDIKATELYGVHAKKNFTKFVVLDIAKDWLRRRTGRIFSALVQKRTNGEYRELLAHTLSSDQIAKIPFVPDDKNLLPIYDVFARDFRFLAFEGLRLFTIGGQTWRIF